MATTATATDDDVFRAFALGDALKGDTARAAEITRGYCDTCFSGWGPCNAPHCAWRADQDLHTTALYSHGVLLALRSEECVVFDARPCHDGERCVCAYMKAIGRATVFAHTHYGDDEVHSLDHGAFVDLAGRLGAIL